MLRITGGLYRGRRLITLPGSATRPTADRVKEALFSILGGSLAGLKAADFFAGSGALGLEALSRGAESVVFVERSSKAARVIRENIKALCLEQVARLFVMNALKPGADLVEQGPFDLILADPPYEKAMVDRLLTVVAENGLLAPRGRMVIEHSPNEAPQPPPELELVDQRAYGQTRLSFFTPKPFEERI